MNREPIPQISYSTTIILLGAFIFWFFVLNKPIDSQIPNLILGLLGTISIGAIVSQLTINIWFLFWGFSSIDYSREFYGRKDVVQIVFDRYMHGFIMSDPITLKKTEYISESVRNYARRRVTVYWVNLIAIVSSTFVVILGYIFLQLFEDYSVVGYISFNIFFVSIISISFIHKKRTSDELYSIEKCYLETWAEKIQKDITKYEKEISG